MASRYRLEPEPPLSDRMLAEIRNAALPLSSPRDLDPLLEQVGDAKYVLLGEASHGTREYYTWRAEISRRLIEEKGFSFIAVEGDWPDCYHVHQFVTHTSREYDSARAVLHVFDRWPTWMWSNEEVLELVDWLQRRNAKELPARRVGFYGLDVYSLWDSMYQVIGYLGRHDSSAIETARRAFRCFEPYGEDVQEYARATRWIEQSCENEVVSLLAELRRTPAPPAGDSREEHFNAEQNALVVKNAEHY
jgi:erythromycin esterase-like protein